MEGATSFGSEDLLGLDVKEEGFDGCGGVPFLVEKKGEACAILIVETGKDVADGAMPNPCRLMPSKGMYSLGTAQSRASLRTWCTILWLDHTMRSAACWALIMVWLLSLRK